MYREFNTHADRLSNEACVEKRPWQLSMAEEQVGDGTKKRKRDDPAPRSDEEVEREGEGDCC